MVAKSRQRFQRPRAAKISAWLKPPRFACELLQLFVGMVAKIPPWSRKGRLPLLRTDRGCRQRQRTRANTWREVPLRVRREHSRQPEASQRKLRMRKRSVWKHSADREGCKRRRHELSRSRRRLEVRSCSDLQAWRERRRLAPRWCQCRNRQRAVQRARTCSGQR